MHNWQIELKSRHDEVLLASRPRKVTYALGPSAVLEALAGEAEDRSGEMLVHVIFVLWRAAAAGVDPHALAQRWGPAMGGCASTSSEVVRALETLIGAADGAFDEEASLFSLAWRGGMSREGSVSEGDDDWTTEDNPLEELCGPDPGEIQQGLVGV